MSQTAEAIAANRRRYDEHQRKGLEFAPRALPQPSSRGGVPIDPASVILRETIPGGWYWSGTLKRGEALRVGQPNGPSSVAMIAWRRDDTGERLNLPDTIKVQWTTALGKGRVLFSDMGRVLFSIIEDSCGAHDPLAGVSTAASNAARYPGVETRNGRDNFVLVAGKHGLARRDIPSALSFFAPARVGGEGTLGWQETLRGTGDFVDLRAEMDLIVGLSNTPHPLDPNPDYSPLPVEIVQFRAPAPLPDDLCRTATAEAVRGFENNARMLA